MSQFVLERAPQTDDELFWAVKALWGVTIPRHTCGNIEHTAPFTAFADAYFERGDYSSVLWQGCVPGDSQISTTEGPVPIKDIEVGERILGWKNGELVYGKVSKTWISSPSREVLGIRTRTGLLRLTGNHRVLVCRKHKGIADGQQRRPPNVWKEEWIKADQIVKGDYLVQPFNNGPDITSAINDPELAEWLGLIWGDGFIDLSHSSKSNYPSSSTLYPRVHISHHPDAAYMDHYRDFVRRRYRKEMSYQRQPYVSKFSSQEAYDDAQCFIGKKAHTKTLPVFLWSAHKDTVKAFLRGYCDADGTVRTKDGSIEWSSVSRELLEQIRHLCLMHGMRAGQVSVAYKAGKHQFQGKEINRRDMYSLRCYDGADIGTNDPKYDFGSRVKQIRSWRSNWQMPQDRDDRRYLRVVEVQNLGEQEVWDMTVDGTDTFVCDTYIVHNSRGFSGKSYLLSILGITKAFLRGADVNILGGSLAQSTNIHEHMRNAMYNKNSPRYMIESEGNYLIRLTNGARIRPLTASQKTIRGPHIPLLILDEIDEMDQEILDGALGQPMDQVNYLGETLKPFTVLCSTHQHPNGTMTEMKKRWESRGQPIVSWCMYCTSNPIDGWLSTEAIEQKKLDIPAQMWSSEFLLNEPSIGNRAFDPDAVEHVFNYAFKPLEQRVEKDLEEYVFEEPVKTGTYVAAADWGKEQDYTVISVMRYDEYWKPARLVYWMRVNRRPYPLMIGWFNKAIKNYNATAIHDGTGLGNVVNDYVDLRARSFIMTGAARSNMLSEYVSAVENGKVEYPKFKTNFLSHKYARVGDLYETSKDFHLPDEVCSLALAWKVIKKNGHGGGDPVTVIRNMVPTRLEANFLSEETRKELEPYQDQTVMVTTEKPDPINLMV